MARPGLLLIGAQKAGTTRLRERLDRHPGTSLPAEKETRCYGGAKLFRRGPDRYTGFFSDLDPSKLTGWASTSDPFDRVPFWFNVDRQLEYAVDLPRRPELPELLRRDLPDARIVDLLRNPVRRAVSAYHHWMRQGELSRSAGWRAPPAPIPGCGSSSTGNTCRISETGAASSRRNRCSCCCTRKTSSATPSAASARRASCSGSMPAYRPEPPGRRVHGSRSWTRCVVN